MKRCPHCKNHLLQKSGSATRVRIKGPVVFDEDGVCRALCYWCSKPVEVPLEIAECAEVPQVRHVVAAPPKPKDLTVPEA